MTTLLAALFLSLTATYPFSCEEMKSVPLSNATVTQAEYRPAETINPAGGKPSPAAGPTTATVLPAHCRVALVLTPSSDSHIEMELWLPAENWNKKFQAVGNGGWAGSINFSAMTAALREGYATASNDTGHTGGNALFGIGHPEKVIDYAWRAVHEMTVTSKTIIDAFYGVPPSLSYWNGCSTGGRQGLMAAQRYPEDFDGIIAGAPANYHSRLHAGDLALAVPVLKDDARKLTPALLALLHDAVMAACDGRDGVIDGLIEDPRSCNFDPAVLLCQGEAAENCLTAPQLETVRSAYAPVRMSNGEIIFPGKEPGSETGWYMLAAAQPSMISIGTFQLTYQDPAWNWRTFETDRDTLLADERTGFINAIDPDLEAFRARGGKLLIYHGWNDTGIAPGNTINYYSSVLSAMGPGQQDWLRLFMVPGMGHCSGGPGPDQAGFMAAMERWREADETPERITAFRIINNRVDMSRPLCPYPQQARYKGIGSINDAENFECVETVHGTGPQ